MATLNDLLGELRADLDERTPGIWQDTDLLKWLNHGVHKVVVGIKGVRQDYFVKRLRSTDAAVTILGVSYSPSSLKLVSGTSIYTLPDDLLEVRSLEPLNQSDRDNGIVFLPRDFSDVEFAQARRLTSASSRQRFFYDIYGINQLLIAPTPAATIETELYYAYFNQEYGAGDTLNILPAWAQNAIKLYASYRAYKSQNHPDTNVEYRRFQEELTDARAFAHPRESQEPKFVEGVFDEDELGPLLDLIPTSS